MSTGSGPVRPVTIVTGGGRGIGAGIARQLASHGRDIAIIYRHDTEAAEATAASTLTLYLIASLAIPALITRRRDIT